MSSYHYTECGLPNVMIEGLEPMIDDEGDEVIQIPFINELHCAIAKGIVSHAKGMSAAELRFLRTEMGLTQAELATVLHVDKQTVGRWERGETMMDGAAETVLRRLAIERLVISFEASIEDLARSSVNTTEEQPISIRKSETGYDLVAA